MTDSKSTKPVAKTAAAKSVKRVAAKVVKPVVAKAAAPVAAVIPAHVPVAVAPVAAAKIIETPAAVAAVIKKEAKTMNDTVTKFAEEAKTRVEGAFGEFQTRAKTAVEKGQANLAEVADFNKGNVEAMVASAKVAAKGVQDIASYTVEYGKSAMEKAVADTKRLYAVKSPTEFFQLQTEITKGAVDEAVAQVSKFTESYLKLIGEVVQPLSNRYALAAEKVKSAVAA